MENPSKMLHSIDLDTLHHILKQYNEDVINNCCQIICKLSNSINETVVPEDLKTFSSIKALLMLYERIHLNNSKTSVKFPISLLIRNIRNALHHHGNDCSCGCALDNDIQLEMLSILNCLFKIPCMESSSEAVEELAKLYNDCMTGMCASTTEKGCKQKCLIFKLKMVQMIYSSLRDGSCEVEWSDFYEKSRSSNLNECEVFTWLVLHSVDSVAMHLLMFSIPGYISCFESVDVLEVIWKEISKSVADSSANYSRVMLVLCHFFDRYFDKAVVKKEFSLSFLLKDANYWHLIRSVLVEGDPILRKHGMYLFKKTVEALNGTSETIVCSKDGIIFYWDSKLKNELYKMYSDIIMVLQFLDEQQVHIIKPVFKQAETLLDNIIQCNELCPFWILILCHKALLHDSTEVVEWGFNSLLTFSLRFFGKGNQDFWEEFAKETVALLVPILNNPALYYSMGLTVSLKLKCFLQSVILLDVSKAFPCLLIRKVCSLVWSPEALFFVMHGIGCFTRETKGSACWGEEEITKIRTFVSKAFKTYNKIIAGGIQCELLGAIMKLTDVKTVPLKSVLSLMSSFPLLGSPRGDSKVWRGIIKWLRDSYAKEDALEILHSYRRQELGKELNDQSLSVVLILLYHFFELEEPNVVSSLLREMLLLFKDIHRRLYCERSLYDQYLSIINHVCMANANDPNERMLAPILPLVNDVMSYIRSELRRISELRDLFTCHLYLNAFENITKVQRKLKLQCEGIDGMYADVLHDLDTFLRSETSPVALYCRIRFLNLLLESYPREIKHDSFICYLLDRVNNPLEKEANQREHTRDIQTQWGRMNSEFIQTKWKIMEYLISKELIIRGPEQRTTSYSISDEDLVKLCAEGLDTAGYGVLSPVMSILKRILPSMKNWTKATEIIGSVWKLMMEKRKTEEFKSLVKGFVEMLFQRELILRGKNAEEILVEYADVFFSNPSLVMVNTLMRHIGQIDLADCSEVLFCHIVGKALVFGPVQRKDEKLTTKVCFYIDKFRICPVWEVGLAKYKRQTPSEVLLPTVAEGIECCDRPKEEQDQEPVGYSWAEKLGDHLTSNEVRARGVERILTLDQESERDEAIAKRLTNTLLKMESEVVFRERYFGDSYVHRVKHRVMQALLLLEPLLSGNQEREKLLKWLYKSLLTENPQPSVRHQQEWLLIRILVKDADLEHGLCDFLEDFSKYKSKGLCSLMAVQFHLSQLLPRSITRDRIELLAPLLLHQHFEVRLHAQLFIRYQYRIAQERNSTDIINRWSSLLFALTKVDSILRKQGSKMYEKLLADFFVHSFDPLKQHTLETIYAELPSADNVAPDEWISRTLFEYCGVNSSKIGVSPKNTEESLKMDVKCFGDYMSNVTLDKEIEDAILANYQKKIIPGKHTPCWEEGSTVKTLTEKKDGLVVVASLIDRVPNLGGLARTCEIFGAAEYVIGSLRCAEDKQFTSLSVTAEKWVAMKEVKAQDLMEYILEMKQNGYTVVGAEQTLLSQPLSSVTFPKKTLLLLGNEKEGIPPPLLPLLDICVEIPQVGVIRSLNVHVTGALFIWEYAKQNHFSTFS